MHEYTYNQGLVGSVKFQFIGYPITQRFPPWALLAPAQPLQPLQRGVPFEIVRLEHRLVAQEPARVGLKRVTDGHG